MQIMVNGKTKQFAGVEISYDNIVQLAFDGPTEAAPTLSYHGQGKSGMLAKGEKVRCEPGMAFYVSDVRR